MVPVKRPWWSVVITSHQQMPPLQSIDWVSQVCSPQFFRFALQQSALSKRLHWSIHLSCLLCRLGDYWQCNRCALLIPWKCHCNLMMMCMNRKSVCVCVCLGERELKAGPYIIKFEMIFHVILFPIIMSFVSLTLIYFAPMAIPLMYAAPCWL